MYFFVVTSSVENLLVVTLPVSQSFFFIILNDAVFTQSGTNHTLNRSFLYCFKFDFKTTVEIFFFNFFFLSYDT